MMDMKTARFITRHNARHDSADVLLLSPNMGGLPAGAESVMAALPIHCVNAWLEAMPDLGKQRDRRIAASVFVADPFLDFAPTLTRICRAGISGVAIWPSIGVFDGVPDFSTVGLGFEREVEFAAVAAAHGLEVTATVFEPFQAKRMLDAGAHRLLLHAPLANGAAGDNCDLADWVRSMMAAAGPDGVEAFLYPPHGHKPAATACGPIAGYVLPPSRREAKRALPRLSASPFINIGAAQVQMEKLPFTAWRREGTIVGAAVSTGAAAQAVTKGGADFIVALSAGRFRMMGAPSIAAYLPLREANTFVDAFAKEEILLHSHVPVLLGVFASDPHRSVDEIVARVLERGYHGITNFPTVGRYSGRYRASLEASGFGIQREYDLVAKARKAGLATLAYARNSDEALRFAEVGADMLCLQFGSGVARSTLPSLEQIEDLAGKARPIVRRVRAKNASIVCLLSGGLIHSPENMIRICGLARADGYIGGSTLDQIPLETSIEDRTAEFKAAPVLRLETESTDRQIRLYRRFGLVTTASDNETVHGRVKRLAAGDSPVVISGEPGTGKSLLAKFIHSIGPFCHRRLESLSLDVESGGISEAALAGLAAGTAGNRIAKLGWFQVLSGQGLVLDRLEKAGPTTQALLLETLESRRFHPLGGTTTLPFDVRLILTSRDSLAQLRTSGKLKEDLYLQLHPAEIELRPLRNRLEDIPTVVEFLLEDIGRGGKKKPVGIAHAALRALQTYDWPGNVRELRSFLEEAALHAAGRKIMLEDFEAFRKKHATNVAQPKQMTEREWIADALRRHRFRRSDTAAFLGISRKTLYSKIKRYHLLIEQ